MSDPRKRDELIQKYWTQVRRSGKAYTEFDWPSVEVLLNLIYTNDIVAARLSAMAAESGITRAGLNVLSILRRHEPQGCRHNEISRLLLVSRANVTGLVESLIRKGLVKRVYDENDRRVCIARITPAGTKLLSAFTPSYFKEIKRLLSGLTSTEKKALANLLSKARGTVLKTETIK